MPKAFKIFNIINFYLIYFNSVYFTLSYESKEYFHPIRNSSTTISTFPPEIHKNIIPNNFDPKKPSVKKRNQIIINQCSDGILKKSTPFEIPGELDPYEFKWSVPDWLKGPKSENRSHTLNQAEFFNGALFKFKIETKELICTNSNSNLNLNIPASNKSSMVAMNNNNNNNNIPANFQTYTVRMSEVYRNNSYDIDWQYGGYSDYFTPFGEFKMNDYFLDPESFCIADFNSEQGLIQLEVCIPKTKIRKCCPYGTVVKFGLSSAHELPTCVEILGEDWAPFYYSNYYGGVEDVSYFSELFNPECNVYDKLTPNRRASAPYLADIKVLADGTVLTRSSGNHKWDKPAVYGENYIKDFCIDGFINSDEIQKKNEEGPVDFLRIQENQIILFCHLDRNESQEKTIYSWLYFFLFTISALVLGAIVVVYVVIWKKQNIHGWTTLSFTWSMCLWFVFSAVVHGVGLFQSQSWGIQVGSAACALNGVLWHFFYIATFSWMAVLNYDLWSSTCTPKISISTTAHKSKTSRKFAMYCCAGFGPPFIVVFIALMIEFNYDIFDDHVVRPMYGQDICCLDKTALLFYAFSVSSVFFVLNLFFAGSTIVFLCKYRKKAKQSMALQKELSHFGKLFILMGFTWIFEMVSWNEEITWYWAIFDVYNIIQAVGLFWIFVGRREVLEQLFEQWRFLQVWCSCLKGEAEKKLSETEKASQGQSQTYKGISMATVGNVLSTCIDMDTMVGPTSSPNPTIKPIVASSDLENKSVQQVHVQQNLDAENKNLTVPSTKFCDHVENHI